MQTVIKRFQVVASHGEAVWTDEGSEYTESDDEFGTVSLGAHKLSTIIKVSEELLNDSAFNLETYISSEFARRMGAARNWHLSTATVQENRQVC